MHEELQQVGLRQVRRWAVALALLAIGVGALFGALAALPDRWPVPDGTGWRMARAAALGGVAGAAGLAYLALTAERSGSRRAWPSTPLLPAPDLEPLVEPAAVARGVPVPRVWRIDAAAPNVACLPGHGGHHVVVSRGAEAGLTRAELAAVMALQLSLLLDPAARRARRNLIAASRMLTAPLWLGLPTTVLVGLATTQVLALTLNVVVWALIGTIGGVVVVQRRIRWGWGVVADGVAIETTRHPGPLANALRRLAGHNDDRVPVRPTFGAADPYWTVRVRASSSPRPP